MPGIAPLNICGPGAHAVAVHELQDRILVSVSAEGVGQQYTIVRVVNALDTGKKAHAIEHRH